MRSFSRILTVLLSLAVWQSGLSAGESAFVGVAYYSPRAEFQADAKRLFAILDAHRIRAITTESASVQVNVPANQAAQARKLISEAVEKEKLRIKLLP